MKKNIIIFCLVFSFFGILIAVSPILLRITGLDGPVKTYIFDSILNKQKHQIDLQDVEIGLGSFQIKKVAFKSEDQRIEVNIDDVVFDFNFLDLLGSLNSPLESLNEIYLNNPRLIIHEKSLSTSISKDTSDSQSLIEQLTGLEAINSLRISNGKIIHINADSNSTVYAQALNGWLTTPLSNTIDLKVEGNALASESENFRMDVNIDLNSKHFNSRIDIQNYSFEDLPLKNYVDNAELKGELSGYLVVNGNISILDSILVNGKLELENVAGLYNNFAMQNMKFDLEFSNNSASISAGYFEYKNHQAKFNGYIENIFLPKLVGEASIEEFPIAELEEFIPTELFNGSTINLKTKYVIDNSNYNINVNLNSNDFSIYKTNFRDCKAKILATNNFFEIKDLFLANDKLSLTGKATYNFEKDNIDLILESNYQLDEHILFDKLSNANHNLVIKLNYYPSSKKSIGKLKYNLAGADTLIFLDGLLKTDSSSVSFNITESNYETMAGKLQVDNFLGMPSIKYAALQNIPFSALTSDKILTGIFKQINTKAVLSGSLNDLQSNLYITEKVSSDTIFTFTSLTKDIFKEHKMISGDIVLKNMHGSFDVDFGYDFFGSYFEFDEGVSGDFFINLGNSEELKGNINIDNFRVMQALSDIFTKDDYRYQGEVDGEIKISGTVKDPIANVKLSGERFVLNEVGYYQPEMNITLNRTSFKADSIKISHNNNKILSGYFDWGLLSNQISGKLRGSGINISTILNTFDIDTSILSGTTNYDFNLKGTYEKPHLDAEISVSQGKLDGITFDEMQLSLIDRIADGKNFFAYENHKIELQKLFIGKQGHYHLNSVGTFPLNSVDEVDLAVNFDGDILGLINHWEPFFRDGASLSEIALRFKGTSDEIKLVAADINIDRGELWLGSVAPHIENISAKINLKEGSNKIDIENLTAYVDKEFLQIKTVRDLKTKNGRELEHWYFKGLDLDFGILSLQTSGSGVSLNIPGLMQDKDLGKIDLSGKTEDETFYLAGPLKHPVGYGLITLNDALITYPFITEKKPSEKPSTAVQFLTNMEWDVSIKAGEDVVYIRDIPAYIDNVETEVTVDEASEGLTFLGIIDKGTFKPVGSLVSTRGRLEYLDLNFKVDRFMLEFNKGAEFPDVSGKAWTTIRDSVGAIPKTIYLQLYAIDSETGEIRQSGNWEDFKFKLVSADPAVGETQEQVLAYLGYSVDNIKEKATNVGGAITEKYLIRPLLRPLERVLERNLGMDLVRFNSSIARNIFSSSFGKQLNPNGTDAFINPLVRDLPYLFLMSSSEVTLGKYLSEDLYLTYTGQLVSVYEQSETGYDFNHSFGLEYRFYQNILVEFEWDRELMGFYNFANQRQYLEDFKVRLRHSFTF